MCSCEQKVPSVEDFILFTDKWKVFLNSLHSVEYLIYYTLCNDEFTSMCCRGGGPLVGRV